MKILFLDVDGVLNSQAWFDALPQSASGLVVLDKLIDRIDPEAVARVNQITDATDAQIILSTNWIYEGNAGLADTKTTLRQAGLKAPFWGATGCTVRKMSLHSRAGEIGMTLWRMQEEAHSPVTGFVILEDEHPLKGFELWTIHTTWEHGLLDEHVEKAIAILETPWNGELPR